MKLRTLWKKSWTDFFAESERELQGKRILEIGAGTTRRPSVTTLDNNPALATDIVHDLNELPWPIADSSFDAVYAFSVLEHVDAPLDVLCEIHRILSPGGRAIVLVPHFSSQSSYDDPTHRWHLSSRSFDYLVESTDLERTYGFYRKARYRFRRKHIGLEGFWDWMPFCSHAVNAFTSIWERYLCFVVRGAGVYVEIEKVDQ
jgi:SAM-dependent methyltransferase